jgi:thymidylate synthase (FAD)
MQGQFVRPKTFLVGYTSIDKEALAAYLAYTGNTQFLDSLEAARQQGLSEGEVLCSFYAKLCYKSLTLGRNSNVTKIRDVPDNLVNCFQQGHGSVFGHCNLNFVTTDCSRLFTHELVRNHVGTEYSQTSGRYVRLDKLDVVLDPILEDCEEIVRHALAVVEDAVYRMECRKGLRKPPELPGHLQGYQGLVNGDCMAFGKVNTSAEHRDKLRWVPNDEQPFSYKKKVTSAIRRLAPNGQANEIGWSVNLRALRHVIQMRSSRHAEWEIRLVMSQVHELVKGKFPLIFHGCKTQVVDGLPEFSGMRTQPYQLDEDEIIKAVSIDRLRGEVLARAEGKG